MSVDVVDGEFVSVCQCVCACSKGSFWVILGYSLGQAQTSVKRGGANAKILSASRLYHHVLNLTVDSNQLLFG